MNKSGIDFKKLRNGEQVKCPECKDGILKTKQDPKITHHFRCDKCGMRINFD